MNVLFVLMNQFVSSALVNISNCFRVVFNLDNAKDTLGKEIVNDELIVSFNYIKRLLLIVFIQDKLIAVINFASSNLDDPIDENHEINEVKATKLVKIIVPIFLEH